ncbi:MAG: class I SAM-dependent methyltransferase [Gammaproteobacteria bacterium]|nr:class I SAM-dependent methyltransferase [Gammaproteobacteria bacterium]
MSTRVDLWNSRYVDAECGAAAWVLHEHAHLLPAKGDALDLACGLGANALRLAKHGLRVWAWDFSSVAIERLGAEAGRRGLAVHGEVRDVVAAPPAPASFDVIVVSHFLERGLFPQLIDALRPGGLLFYQTFTTERPEGSSTPSNPAFLLKPGELLELCRPLRLLVYREDSLFGDLRQGLRAVAALVGAKA